MIRLPIDITRKEALWFVVAGVLFAGLLYFADVGDILDALGRANRRTFAVAVVVGFSSLLVWAWVWHRFFGTVGIKSTPSRTLQLFMTGQFLNSITPLGQFGGEPVMAYIVSDNTDAEYESALACVVSADILNAAPFITLTLGGIGYLAVVGSLPDRFAGIGILTALVLLVGAGLAYFLWSGDGRLGTTLTRLIEWFEARSTRAAAPLQSLRESILDIEAAFERAGGSPRFLLATVSGSHLAVVAQIVSLYFVFVSIGIEPTFVPLYLIVNLSVVATISPTPGGSGTYEAAFAGLVTVLYPGETLATGVTAAILFRLTTYWPGLVVGFLSMLTLPAAESPSKAE